MFEHKTHNGFLLCLFALVMLVMSGVGIRALMDICVKRDALEQNLLGRQQKIMDLQKVICSLEITQAGADFRAQIEQDKLNALETQKYVLLASLRNLRSGEIDATTELESVEKEFSTYQVTTRKLIWSKSVGYNLGALTIGYGTTYEGARISEISEHGVKIVHDSGTSFIRSNDMPASLQEKFQLVIATDS
ncbi:MAG: hypothetical protein V4727_10010 [Verrucomicrobiota bacterium]